MDFEHYCQERLKLINGAIDQSLLQLRESVSQRFGPLIDAMEYSLEGKGKRLRPLLLVASSECLGLDARKLMPAACAVEYLHTYSLIHDDLPAMDDDDFRRGRASNHKKFGEATAILAGDALLTEAFRQFRGLSLEGGFEPQNVLEASFLLAQHGGVGGLVGGQSLDISANQKEYSLPELEFIHIHKTGALILVSVLLPAVISAAPAAELQMLKRYGEALGLAFQISDDLLDAEAGLRYARGPSNNPGPNYTQLMGMSEAKQRLIDLISTSIEAIRPLGEKADALIEIAKFIQERKH